MRYFCGGRDDEAEVRGILVRERLTTDRQILFFFTYLSGRQVPFRASENRTGDDGQTNSVLFL